MSIETSGKILIALGFARTVPLLNELASKAQMRLYPNLSDMRISTTDSLPDGLLLHADTPTEALMNASAHWYSNSTTFNRPLLLLGGDQWTHDHQRLANDISADAYLPFSASADLVLRSIDRIKKRFEALKERVPDTNHPWPSFDDKLIEMLRIQALDPNDSIAQMAYNMGMSVSRFQRTIKRLTGKTPVEYMNHVKLVQAEHMLKLKQGTVSDVAYHCGFNSVAYFCRQFKREFGMTPSELIR